MTKLFLPSSAPENQYQHHLLLWCDTCALVSLPLSVTRASSAIIGGGDSVVCCVLRFMPESQLPGVCNACMHSKSQQPLPVTSSAMVRPNMLHLPVVVILISTACSQLHWGELLDASHAHKQLTRMHACAALTGSFNSVRQCSSF